LILPTDPPDLGFILFIRTGDDDVKAPPVFS